MPPGYLELKIAWKIFQKAPEALTASESVRMSEIVARQGNIEQSILASGDSASVIIPQNTLAARIAEIRARYSGEIEFSQDMARFGLTENSLRIAVERDLRIEALLERVASTVPVVSQVEAEIFYRLHPESFTPPESRELRHILITVNNTGERNKAIVLLDLLRSTLENEHKFGAAALRHSQCPTALEGGKLGKIKQGQLFPELEESAFLLKEGEISSILASPIGLHIIRCDRIHPSVTLTFAETESKIIELLTDKRRAKAQRDWIRSIS